MVFDVTQNIKITYIMMVYVEGEFENKKKRWETKHFVEWGRFGIIIRVFQGRKMVSI